MHISYRRSFIIYRKEFKFLQKIRGASKKLKACRVAHSGLDLLTFVNRFEIYLLTQSH
jgi:hypothetical protein